MKSRMTRCALAILFFGTVLGSALPVSHADDEGVSSDSSVSAPATDDKKACQDSFDCLPATEHCLNGQCQPRLYRCYSNFDCSGWDHCINGVCR